MIGQTVDKFHQCGIQKRRPDLQGMHHGTTVHLDQNVIQEILAREEIEDPADGLLGRKTLIESLGFRIKVLRLQGIR